MTTYTNFERGMANFFGAGGLEIAEILLNLQILPSLNFLPGINGFF